MAAAALKDVTFVTKGLQKHYTYNVPIGMLKKRLVSQVSLKCRSGLSIWYILRRKKRL